MIHVRGNIYEGDAELEDKVKKGSIIKRPRGKKGCNKNKLSNSKGGRVCGSSKRENEVIDVFVQYLDQYLTSNANLMEAEITWDVGSVVGLALKNCRDDFIQMVAIMEREERGGSDI
ncbi:Uncharacterized protein TCM_013981 [Theobroma cacao]|uniref:Uncharacterized protein n=1 Tax=Theobroma cacao TaxID=3641 RepID=A0A061G478_THECC|nr:Uncharacterized protein TCM_013981 [Theobroma cacao]